MSGSCPEEEEYIPVDKAVAQVREDVPGLIQFIREKVDTIVQTRSKLDELLKRVDQEKVSVCDRKQCRKLIIDLVNIFRFGNHFFAFVSFKFH